MLCYPPNYASMVIDTAESMLLLVGHAVVVFSSQLVLQAELLLLRTSTEDLDDLPTGVEY